MVRLRTTACAAPFAAGAPLGTAIARGKSDKAELYLKVLSDLLRDLLVLSHGAGEVRNQDIRRDLETLAARVGFSWIRQAIRQVDELVLFLRHNIQKLIAVDARILELRAAAAW